MTGAKANPDEAMRAARKFPGLKGMDLARLVSTKQTYQWNQGSIWPERQSVYTKRVASFHVVAYDYGIKRNILRLIADQDCRLTVVPATTSADEVMSLLPDGVFLSNGPGDPGALRLRDRGDRHDRRRAACRRSASASGISCSGSRAARRPSR